MSSKTFSIFDFIISQNSEYIFLICLKGEFTKENRAGVVNCVYEARPMMKDHKQDVKEDNLAKGPQF